jgi:hypothetical protein
MSELAVTRPNKPWLVKMVIFAVVLFGFGAYGYWDATQAYPQRGINYASFAEFQYLGQAKDSGRLDSSVSVSEPAGEFTRLNKAVAEGKVDRLEEYRLNWLLALHRVHKLDAAHTTIADPDAAYADLKKKWTTEKGTRDAPKALGEYDIAVQWLFTAIGLGGGFLLLIHIIRIARRRYTWDAATQRLTLPGGASLVPAEIEDFDKRKWDKFLIFLQVKPDHPTLGGREVKLDLYHHDPLETWVLEMERTRFPERAQEQSAESAGTPDSGAPANASPTTPNEH